MRMAWPPGSAPLTGKAATTEIAGLPNKAIPDLQSRPWPFASGFYDIHAWTTVRFQDKVPPVRPLVNHHNEHMNGVASVFGLARFERELPG